jgi:hypothetical protein
MSTELKTYPNRLMKLHLQKLGYDMEKKEVSEIATKLGYYFNNDLQQWVSIIAPISKK